MVFIQMDVGTVASHAESVVRRYLSTCTPLLLNMPPAATIMPRGGNLPQSLSNAELAKHPIEHVVCADGADYFA
jgi:hypothetical protein